MATYNGATYLQQQLDSLACQVLRPDELVITDDGSTDDTMLIAEQFSRRAPFPVRIFKNEVRLGYRANFINNATMCKHDLIAFCDQDDLWHPEKLLKVARSFDNPDVVLCYHNAWLIDKDGVKTGRADIAKVHALNPPLSIHPYTWGLGFLLVFHKSLMQFSDLWAKSVDTIEPHNPMAHDMWVYFLASVFGYIAYIDEDLVDYRQHGQNTVGFQWAAESRWKRIRSRMVTGAAEYDRLARVSWSRHDILEAASARLDGVLLQRAKSSSILYRQCAEWFELRSNVYTSRKISSRLSSIWHLLHGGAYSGNNAWGFSYKSLAKDSLIAGFHNFISDTK